MLNVGREYNIILFYLLIHLYLTFLTTILLSFLHMYRVNTQELLAIRCRNRKHIVYTRYSPSDIETNKHCLHPLLAIRYRNK